MVENQAKLRITKFIQKWKNLLPLPWLLSWQWNQCNFTSATTVVPWYYLQMIWRNVVSNSCTFFSDYNLLWSLAFCQSAKAAVIYVTSLHVWNVLVRFVVKSTETDLQIYTMVWYTYYSIVRVLPTVQVAANETYIPFAILCLEREGKMLSLWKK